MSRTKFVTIESYGPLRVLGGIMGPITSPCYLDISVIISLINSGKIVYEVNPKNTKEKVRLTIDNVLKYNFDFKVIKENTNSKTTTPKKSNMVVSKPQVKPNEVKKEIIKPEKVKNEIVESKTEKLGIDLFISNKKS